MENHSEGKAKRILEIYTRIRQGKIVYKAETSEMYGVSPRTIQRDIADIQCFLQDLCMETGSIQEIIFDKHKGGYLLQSKQNHYLSEKDIWDACRVHVKQNYCLSEKDILAVCRILLGSEALVKAELFPIVSSLIALCGEPQAVVVEKLLQDGVENYVEPQHSRKLIEQLWNLENAVKEKKFIEILYDESEEGKEDIYVVQKLRPVKVMYIDSCFYLIASILDEELAEIGKRKEERGRFKRGKAHVFYQIECILEYTVMEG